MSSSNFERHQAKNINSAKCFAKLSNCFTGRKKKLQTSLIKVLVLQTTSAPICIFQLAGKCTSTSKPVFTVPELSLQAVERTTLQYTLQRLSKLSDMAANYLCFSFLLICSLPRILAISQRDSFIIFNGCWRGPAFKKAFKKANTTHLKVLGCPCEKVNFH